MVRQVGPAVAARPYPRPRQKRPVHAPHALRFAAQTSPGAFFTAQQPLPVPRRRARFLQYARPCVPPVGPQPVHLGSLEAQRCALRQPVARGSRQPATTKFVVGSTQAQQTELPHAGPWGAGQARYASDRRFCAAWRARLHGDVRLSSVCPPRCLRPPCCWHQSKLKPDLKIWGSAKF